MKEEKHPESIVMPTDTLGGYPFCQTSSYPCATMITQSVESPTYSHTESRKIEVLNTPDTVAGLTTQSNNVYQPPTEPAPVYQEINRSPWPTIDIDITNEDFFFMIENQIRDWMKVEEEKIYLPIARELLKKSGISLHDLELYPVEGYYHESEGLREYFKLLRNFQHNEKVYEKLKPCEELTKLQNLCHNDIWGIEDERERSKSPLRRRYDIVTLTMESKKIFPDQDENPWPWTIERIMNGLSSYFDNRTNLVELAYLINNPKLICCAAETNCMYRMFACISGSYSMGPVAKEIYHWKVDKDVEEMGARLIAEYNKLLSEDRVLVVPSLDNHIRLEKSPKLPRVSMLGYVLKTNQYYHWILDEDYKLIDKYSQEIITTESYTKKQGTGFFGNIYSATP